MSSEPWHSPLAPSDDAPAIRVQNLGKCYEIYARPQDRLKQTLCRGSRKFYQEFWALRDISFDVSPGETLGIIGRNGSGKSTLLQLLCGTLAPTTGSVQTRGRIAALLELGAGFNPEFTGRENVHMNARLLGLSTEEILAAFDAIASFADIGSFLDQPVKTYSSGMYVRLAFAVIAHIHADILIIDEALAVGDVFFTQKCMRFLRSFSEHGTIVFVSHDSAAVVNLCQRALWLDQGVLQAIGPAKETSESYFAAFYRTQNPEIASGTAANSAPLESGSEPAAGEAAPAPTVSETRSFGSRGATITSVALHRHPAAAHAAFLTSVHGGEDVTLLVQAVAHQAIAEVLVGFYIKDRLGQNLFGDNTCKVYLGKPVALSAEQPLEAAFTFQMPTLLPGDYTIDVSIAQGTQDRHIQHHWIRDAYAFKSLAQTESTGLVGIPMRAIELRPIRRPASTVTSDYAAGAVHAV